MGPTAEARWLEQPKGTPPPNEVRCVWYLGSLLVVRLGEMRSLARQAHDTDDENLRLHLATQLRDRFATAASILTELTEGQR